MRKTRTGFSGSVVAKREVRPQVVSSFDPRAEGWQLIFAGAGSAVAFGPLPSLVREVDMSSGKPVPRVVSRIVGAELRGDDWYGRVELAADGEVVEPGAPPVVEHVPKAVPPPMLMNRKARRAREALARRAR